MIQKVVGAVLIVAFIAAYIFAMVYANCVYGYGATLFVFVGSMCAFGFVIALEMLIHDD